MVEKMAEKALGETTQELGVVLKSILENLEEQTRLLKEIEQHINPEIALERLKKQRQDNDDTGWRAGDA
jgi:hypothetical protein